MEGDVWNLTKCWEVILQEIRRFDEGLGILVKA